MSVQFEDYSMQVREAIEAKSIAFLEEAAAEIESAVKRLTRVDTGKLKGSWRHETDESDLSCQIGSSEENALWEEFGTGEYAANGDGRQGAWYVPEEAVAGSAKKPTYNGQVVIVYGTNGQVFYKTNGKKAQHMLQKAYESRKNAIIKRAQQIFKEL